MLILCKILFIEGGVMLSRAWVYVGPVTSCGPPVGGGPLSCLLPGDPLKHVKLALEQLIRRREQNKQQLQQKESLHQADQLVHQIYY